MKTIYIDYSKLVTTIYIIEDGVLDNLFFSFSSPNYQIGNIYSAKVNAICKGLESVFLESQGKRFFMEYKEERSFGPLRRDMAAPLKQGERVLVRLTKEAVQKKGERVVPDMTFAGRSLVLIDSRREVIFSNKLERDEHICKVAEHLAEIKDENVGFIIRTQAKNYSQQYIEREAELLTKQYYTLLEKFDTQEGYGLLHIEEDLIAAKFRDNICMDDDIAEIWVNNKQYYDYLNTLATVDLPNIKGKVKLYDGIRTMYTHFKLAEYMASLSYDTVALKNGGNLIIEKTQALVTIDVNSAQFLCESVEQTAYETNKAAAIEVARQIRLRDLSGIIVVDFIDMKDKQHKADIVRLLEEHTAGDYSTVRVAGLTQLGLCEMTRERVRNGMEHITSKSCPYCKGKGQVASDLMAAYNIKCALFDLIYQTKAKEVGIHCSECLCEYVKKQSVFSEYFKNCLLGVKIYLIPEQGVKHDYFKFNLALSEQEKKTAFCCNAHT